MTKTEAIAKIDAHQHYWDVTNAFPASEGTWFLGAASYAWKRTGLGALDRSFLPDELEPQLEPVGIQQTILVNVLHNVDETQWMLALADSRESIAGVVGWVDLTEPADLVALALDRLYQYSKFVGIRHLTQFEHDRGWLLRPDVIAGLRVLESRAIPFDLLLEPVHLEVIPDLSEQLPDLSMVIDHAAKPKIRNGILEPWAARLRAAAENPHLYCKLSGLVTEADRLAWTPDDLLPYVHVVLEAFGPDRVMYGSDWPVSTLAATYEQVYGSIAYCLTRIFGRAEEMVERAIFGENATRFYGIGHPRGDRHSATPVLSNREER